MKKLTTILLLLLMSSAVFAQNSKPTKEETVQFIKSELQDKKLIRDYFTRGPYKGDVYPTTTSIYSIWSNINMNDCRFKFTYHWMNTEEKNGVVVVDKKYSSVTEVSIDFNRVEQITIDRYGEDIGSYIFKVKNDNGNYENKMVLIGSIESDPHSQKLSNAFQHLRKLCGAPEPISFD